MSKIFNDPVHGRIEIPESCVKIIDTIEFQRLRNLKQLGLTNYVFHGATHTSFEHSIGVCYLSGEWAKHLQRKHPELNITYKDIEIVQIAGLIHDIGHGPFSHTFERFIKRTRPDINYNHEEMTINIFKKINCCSELVINSVCDIIRGTQTWPGDKQKGTPSKVFLASIVHNTINGLDADKLDYFIRDSQCTSFAIGCDWKRIVYESEVMNNEIVFPRKMIGDIFNIYQIRFRLYRELYFHKTVRIIEDAILDLIVSADSAGVFNFNGRSLSYSVDSVDSFLLTGDDIIGQIERCNLPSLVNSLNLIKTRNFNTDKNLDNEPRYVNYGMKEENPLLKVTFVDKDGKKVEIDQTFIDTMIPKKFAYSI